MTASEINMTLAPSGPSSDRKGKPIKSVRYGKEGKTREIYSTALNSSNPWSESGAGTLAREQEIRTRRMERLPTLSHSHV